MKASMSTRKLAVLGIMAAISVILVYLIRIPFPGASFLEYDPADIPILICTFIFGPLSGFILTVVVSLIQGFTVSAESGIIGAMMHIFATGSFVLVAGIIYKHNKSRTGAVIGLCAGIIVMTISMCVWNLLFTPIFLNIPREAVIPMILPLIVPFNLMKAGINSIITFIAYKKIAGLIDRN